MIKKPILLLSLILLLTSAVFAETIETEFSFEIPQIENVGEYHRIISRDMFSIGEPGEPEIPSKAIQILLPQGESVKSIAISYQEHSFLEDEYNVIPYQAPQPISYQGNIEFDEQDKVIYSSNQLFPNEQFTEVNMQYFRGHSIALINLYPIQYNPVTKKIKYSTNIILKIETEPSSASLQAFNSFYRNDERSNRRLENVVSNPEYLSRYPQAQVLRDETFDYVIITNNSYSNYFNDFVSFKVEQGYNVVVKTTEDIYAEYAGTDNQDKIRNYIIDAYQNLGAEYVLLGGDTNVIPHRGFWVNAGGTEDFGIPSDLYYSALDRVGTGTGPDWNVNNNNKWGETSEADYLGEIYIGRISANTTTELTAALNKQMMYQDNPVVGDLEEALMVGEELNNSPLTYGGDYKDQIITGGYFDGYSTAGIDNNMNVETLYDRDSYWGSAQLFTQMNNGLNLLNHLGHSNIDYNMKLYMSAVSNGNITANGTNHNFFIIYSQGCLPAAIDANCIAEKFTTIDNGCVVFVGNSRYGWYQPGGTNSCSQYLDRQFFDALFGEDIYTIGAMNSDSKDDGAPQCGNAWFRWGFYEVNVLGDPSLDVWTAEPEVMTTTYDPSIPIGISEVQLQTDAPFTRVALLQNGELIGNAIADGNGDVTVTTYEPITTPDVISVSIIGHNKIRHSGEIVVVSNQPYVIFDEIEIDDANGNNNGLPDFSETIAFNITLKNVGTVNANSVTAILSSDDDYVTISDGVEFYGDIAAQSNVYIENGFTIEVAADVPDLHQIYFEINATDSNNEVWDSSFMITVNAPVFLAESMVIIDLEGNNNGVLDPGETVTVIVESQNIGHADSQSSYASLSIDDDLVTIEEDVYSLGVIPAQQSINAIYTITADASIAVGTILEIEYTIISGSYIYQNNFNHTVGIIKEDFESGNFSSFDWDFTGNADWVISDGAHEGNYCAKSGAIGNNASSGLSIEADVTASGEISFWRTVSSENNYDYLRFYIDGALQDEWCGDQGWTEESYYVSAGAHVFEWKYVKDQGVTGGTDCARIDYIIFPEMEGTLPAILSVNPQIINMEMGLNAFETLDIELSNIGGELLEFSITASGNPDWLDFTPNEGEIEIGASADLELIFNTNGIEVGIYSCELSISYNTDSETIIPITLTVLETDANNILLPQITEYRGNYPNPFNPSTAIKFNLKKDSEVELSIYNIRGQKVKTIVHERLPAGYHSMIWNGKDDNNNNVSSGIYFSSFKAMDEEYTSVKKMILMK